MNQTKLIEKLARLIKDPWTVALILNILAKNLVQIQDNISRSEWINQTYGVLQVDPLSPIPFNVLTHDAINKESNNMAVYMYADDMALASNNRSELQKAIDALAIWAEGNELEVNRHKTEFVVFRRGGRLSANTGLYYKGQPLGMTNMHKYIGVTIQMTGTTFSIHIKQRLIDAVRAISDIKNIQLLSLKTAMRLFEGKLF